MKILTTTYELFNFIDKSPDRVKKYILWKVLKVNSNQNNNCTQLRILPIVFGRKNIEAEIFCLIISLKRV